MTAVKPPSALPPTAAWSVLDEAATEFTILDETGRILYVNPANAQFSGWHADALIGQSVGVFLPAEFRDRVPGLLEELFRSGSLEDEFVNIASDGSRRRVMVRARVASVGDPPQRYIVAEIRDLSGTLEQLERLSAAALALSADPETDVLSSILRGARTLIRARYAALGLFDDAGTLVRFIPDGLSDEEIARIDHWPQGRGLLRSLAEEARTINIADMRTDPRAVGFPAGHPGMVSFLGVPIGTGGRVHGQLYLTDKQGAPAFSHTDERLAELFAAHAAAAIRDARRTAELHRSEEQFRASIELLADAFGICSAVRDDDGRIVDFRVEYSNGALDEISGTTAATRQGRTLLGLFPAGVRQRGLVEAFARVVETGEPFVADGAHWSEPLTDRQVVAPTYDIRAARLGDGIVLMGRDVTAQRLATEALRQTEEQYRLIAENAFDLISVTDDQGNAVYASPSFDRILGIRPDELIGRPLAGWMHPDDLAVRETWRDDEAAVVRLRHADGAWRWIEGTSHTVVRDGRPLRIGVGRDITERRAADLALREQDARLRELVADLGVIIWERDPVTFESRYVSAGAQDVLGYSPEQWAEDSRLWQKVIHKTDRAGVVRVFAAAAIERHPFSVEYRALAADGSDRWLRSHGRLVLDATGRPASIRGVTVDITEEKQLEVRLRQAEKMEAIGKLAGGVAHDFNNLLTAIRGYGELARLGLRADDASVREDIDAVVENADRATELTRQLVAFSRRQVLQPRVLDPAVIVDGIVPLLRRLLGEHIGISVAAQPGAGLVRVDPTQLEQVIVNLAVNARDAMPEGGTLAVETSAVTLDATDQRTHPEVVPGQYLLLAISDTGMGMDSETQSRIFEPFFTTKDQGLGTGLGLATVYGIVKQSGGWIYVQSEPGRGTSFRIYLPRVVDEAAAAVDPPPPAEPTPTGSETILVVEDQSAVRAYVARVLVGLGYGVLQAASGAEALEIAASHAGRIHLVVTDVVMPGMQGHNLAVRLMELVPATRVLFMSGYTEGGPGKAALAGDAHFLAKPFTAEDLGRAVREALSHSG